MLKQKGQQTFYFSFVQKSLLDKRMESAAVWEVIHEENADGIQKRRLFAEEKLAIEQKDLLVKEMLVSEKELITKMKLTKIRVATTDDKFKDTKSPFANMNTWPEMNIDDFIMDYENNNINKASKVVLLENASGYLISAKCAYSVIAWNSQKYKINRINASLQEWLDYSSSAAKVRIRRMNVSNNIVSTSDFV